MKVLGIGLLFFTLNQFVCSSFPADDPLVPQIIQVNQKVISFKFNLFQICFNNLLIFNTHTGRSF